MSFIIVKRSGRADVRDLAVFTGQITVAPTQKDFTEGCPLVMGIGEISERIDDAFLFPDAAQAVYWAARLMPDWIEEEQKFVPLTWVVRKYPHFAPGQYIPESINIIARGRPGNAAARSREAA